MHELAEESNDRLVAHAHLVRSVSSFVTNISSYNMSFSYISNLAKLPIVLQMFTNIKKLFKVRGVVYFIFLFRYYRIIYRVRILRNIVSESVRACSSSLAGGAGRGASASGETARRCRHAPLACSEKTFTLQNSNSN